MTVKNWARVLWYQHQIIVNKQLLVCLGLVLLLPWMIGFREIQLTQAAMVTEVYMSLIGFILIGTVNYPESDRDFSSLLNIKSLSLGKIWMLRVFEEMLITIFFMLVWVIFLHHFNHQILIPVFVLGGVSTAFLWGAIASSIAIITRSMYTGILGALVTFFYIIFGMDKQLTFYPLGLLINPNQTRIMTIIVLVGSVGLLSAALVYNYQRGPEM